MFKNQVPFLLMWYLLNLKNKKQKTQNKPECIYATGHSLFLKILPPPFPVLLGPSPTSQALPTPSVPGRPVSALRLLLFPPHIFLTTQPAKLEPFLTPFCPSLLIPCSLPAISAGTGPVKSSPASAWTISMAS